MPMPERHHGLQSINKTPQRYRRNVPFELFPTVTRAQKRDLIIQEQADGLFLAWQQVGELLKGAMDGKRFIAK